LSAASTLASARSIAHSGRRLAALVRNSGVWGGIGLEEAPARIHRLDQRGCFCHVKDVVRALADLLDSDQHFGQVFNIGSREEVSIMELAERVRDFTGSASEIVTIPYEEAYEEGFEDMHRRVPDTSKIKAAIGWQQTFDLNDILEDVLTGVRAAVAA
jgi:nucleoside-diphosphate-sugar epimerase